MKINDTEAHIGLGNKELQPGDKVSLFENACGGGGKSGFPHCEKVKVGEGQVTETLNENYSVIHVSPGVDFKEGTIVEKR